MVTALAPYILPRKAPYATATRARLVICFFKSRAQAGPYALRLTFEAGRACLPGSEDPCLCHNCLFSGGTKANMFSWRQKFSSVPSGVARSTWHCLACPDPHLSGIERLCSGAQLQACATIRSLNLKLAPCTSTQVRSVFSQLTHSFISCIHVLGEYLCRCHTC